MQSKSCVFGSDSTSTVAVNLLFVAASHKVNRPNHSTPRFSTKSNGNTYPRETCVQMFIAANWK